MSHVAEAVVVTCIDFRFQDYINDWIAKNIPPKSHDRVAFAGSVKNLEIILGQIEVSKRLHEVKRVILINHEDCGAYGEAGTPEKHAEDLKSAAEKIKEQLPDLNVETYYLHLDGTFEKV
jgi:carbonic anhydrase